jgi:hypothetical protein
MQQGERGHRKREYCTNRCKQKAHKQRSAPPEPELPEAKISALEQEIQRLREPLALEERYRTDTHVRHFKNWLCRHSDKIPTFIHGSSLIPDSLNMAHVDFMRHGYASISI